MSQQITGYFDHTAAGGDTFDSLAFRFYTEERIAHYIIQANPDYADVLIFEGGEKLRIPTLESVESPDTLPPWRRPKNISK